ncbi:MAG: UDP-2,4-diacetamido-2,4,6-trideoxy-beta-L-altropyranose hydrolase, partial [Thermodesulfobacteriota bacterium]
MARPRLSHTFFRTDASFSIGTGHVMRCLTLANELSQKGATIKFICREEPGHMINHIEEQGYQVYRLPSGIDLETDLKLSKGYLEKHSRPIDWLVVDHYDMDIRWESCMRQSVHKIMVIDDMINRVHDCDILLNQNYGFFEEQYQGLVPNHCIQLLGPKYALLRPQFRKVLENLRERDGEVKRILVFMGGADPTNQTCKVLRAIKKLNSPDITVDTVIGASNPNRGEVERLSSEIPNASC